jgi:hypothetical protein
MERALIELFNDSIKPEIDTETEEKSMRKLKYELGKGTAANIFAQHRLIKAIKELTNVIDNKKLSK